MKSFLVAGGVGDQLYQLLCIASMKDAGVFRVCVSQRDRAKTCYIAELINQQSATEDPFDVANFKIIDDEIVAELLDFCLAHNKEAQLTGGFTAYAPGIGLVTCLWPALSNDIASLFDASSNWVNLYERYVGGRITSNLDSRYRDIYNINEAKAAIAGAGSVFASPNANSVPIDMYQINELLAMLKNPAWHTVKVHSNTGNARRLDIKSTSDESPLSETFAAGFSNLGIETQLVGGDLVALHAQIKQSDLVLTVRSGLTDLAYFTGRSLLTYYPSMEIYGNYRMSRREVVLKELRSGGLCTVLVSN
jgi:hypothetical protein